MYKQDDLIDAIMEHLMAKTGTPVPAASPVVPARRVFLSEFEIRKRLTSDSRELRIPRGAIISPLALDWLSLKGVRIVEE